MKYKILLIISCIITISPLALAFGATAPYWSERPLIMPPKESKTIPIILQNMVGEKDIILKAEITSGNEIATLENPDKEYTVPFGRKDIKANLKIEIPENPKKNKYQITLFFKQISENKKEMLQMSGGVTVSFPLIIDNSQTSKEKITTSPASPQDKTKEKNPETKSDNTNILFYLIITAFIIAISIIITSIIILIKKSNLSYS
jgi:heme/copper-type cytochrome/quinol oxidase subunit 4